MWLKKCMSWVDLGENWSHESWSRETKSGNFRGRKREFWGFVKVFSAKFGGVASPFFPMKVSRYMVWAWEQGWLSRDNQSWRECGMVRWYSEATHNTHTHRKRWVLLDLWQWQDSEIMEPPQGTNGQDLQGAGRRSLWCRCVSLSCSEWIMPFYSYKGCWAS